MLFFHFLTKSSYQFSVDKLFNNRNLQGGGMGFIFQFFYIKMSKFFKMVNFFK